MPVLCFSSEADLTDLMCIRDHLVPIEYPIWKYAAELSLGLGGIRRSS